jgi:hypothetical protein
MAALLLTLVAFGIIAVVFAGAWWADTTEVSHTDGMY